MADIKGRGLKDHNLVLVGVPCKGKPDKNGKMQNDYVRVVAALDQRSNPQSNPFLTNNRFTTPDGQYRVSHGENYTTGQFQAMCAAAGEGNAVQMPDGSVQATLRASLMYTKDRRGLMINTKEAMSPSEYGWTPDTMDIQNELREKERAKQAAERAEKRGKTQEAEKDAPEVAADSRKRSAPSKPKAAAKAAPVQEAPSADNEMDIT